MSEDNILGGGNSTLEGLEMEKNWELLEYFIKALSASGSPRALTSCAVCMDWKGREAKQRDLGEGEVVSHLSERWWCLG